jgi:hypothetical protein
MKNVFKPEILRSMSKSLAYLLLLSASKLAFALQDNKSFDPSTIPVGGSSVLEITVHNNDGATGTNLFITDNLPAQITLTGTTFISATNCGALTGTWAVGSNTIALTGGTVLDDETCTVRIGVTSNTASSPTGWVNTIASEQMGYTVNGGLEPGDTVTANLIVTAPVSPTVAKFFYPHEVNDCGCSLLVIYLNNPATTAATLTFPFVDIFPRDLRTVGRAQTTCQNAFVTTGGSSVTLQTGAVIPANGFCTISVDVESYCNGEFTNRIAPGALSTTNGSNLLGAEASVEFCCEDITRAHEQCLVENSLDIDENMSRHVE